MHPNKWRKLTGDELFGKENLVKMPEGHVMDDLIKDASPDGYLVVPEAFRDRGIGKKIFNMEVRPDDVWIITFPKCGTTWTQVRRVITV